MLKCISYSSGYNRILASSNYYSEFNIKQTEKKLVLLSRKYLPKTTFRSFNHPFLLKYTNNQCKDFLFGISIKF